MTYFLLFLFGGNLFAQMPTHKTNASRCNIESLSISTENNAKKLGINNKLIEVYFGEDFHNLEDLYDFRNKTGIEEAFVCLQNKNLRSPKMIYDAKEGKVYLLINPYIKIHLSSVCENKKTERWTIPIKSEGQKNIHHYPYFYINEPYTYCQGFSNETDCKRIYYNAKNGEIDTRARIKISKISDKINIKIYGQSIRLLINSINQVTKNENKINMNFLCSHNGEKVLLDPFEMSILHLNKQGKEKLKTNIFMDDYSTTCLWYE